MGEIFDSKQLFRFCGYANFNNILFKTKQNFSHSFKFVFKENLKCLICKFYFCESLILFKFSVIKLIRFEQKRKKLKSRFEQFVFFFIIITFLMKFRIHLKMCFSSCRLDIPTKKKKMCFIF